MKKSNFEKYTDEQLINKGKQTKTLSFILLGLLIVLLIVTGYQSITTEFNPLIIIPFALFPIVIANYAMAKKIRTEINSRENK